MTDDYSNHHERTLAKHVEKIDRLSERLRECANLLGDYINAEYPGDLRKQYPDIYERRYKRDIQPVMDARAELERDIEI